jgi:hypothetical protein
MNSPRKVLVYLDGTTLTCEDLYGLSSVETRVDLTPEAWKRVEEGRKVVDDMLLSNEKVYGINTGFGALADVAVILFVFLSCFFEIELHHARFPTKISRGCKKT